MKNVVLDSYAVLCFLYKERGHEKVLALFEMAVDNDKKLLISAPNWTEISYIILRKAGFPAWAEVRGKLLGLPIKIIDAGQELAEMAGEIKATHKMSLANCFAAALAKKEGAEIYTGDPEFQAVSADLPIIWL